MYQQLKSPRQQRILILEEMKKLNQQLRVIFYSSIIWYFIKVSNNLQMIKLCWTPFNFIIFQKRAAQILGNPNTSAYNGRMMATVRPTLTLIGWRRTANALVGTATLHLFINHLFIVLISITQTKYAHLSRVS